MTLTTLTLAMAERQWLKELAEDFHFRHLALSDGDEGELLLMADMPANTDMLTIANFMQAVGKRLRMPCQIVDRRNLPPALLALYRQKEIRL